MYEKIIATDGLTNYKEQFDTIWQHQAIFKAL